MALSIQGILTSLATQAEQTTVLTALMREVFINDCPLWSRLAHDHIGAPEYNIITYDVRQRPLTLASALTAVAALTTATVTFADTTQLQQGDVIEIFNTAGTAFERAEVIADSTATTVSLMRGVEGTTPVANDLTAPANNTAYLIGNSRTGAEVDQRASRSIRTLVAQHVQTYQFPVQVGGLVQAIDAIQLPPGMNSVFNLESVTKMQEFARDVEYTSYYGVGQRADVANATQRRKQVGLRQQIRNYNNGLNYRAGAGGAYTRLNFVNDLIQKARNGQGNPDVLLVGLDAETAFATWTIGMQQILDSRQTQTLGITVEEYNTNLGGRPLRVVPSSQIRPGTFIALTSRDLRFRVIREAFFQKRGFRGDAFEGDYIGDYCLELGHPAWHSMVEGITGYA
jgi:hypothetical protein